MASTRNSNILIPRCSKINTNMHTSGEEHGKPQRETYFSPGATQKQGYNETTNEMKPTTVGQLIGAITATSALNMKKRDPAVRKTYISQHMWAPTKQKQEARDNEDCGKELALRKEARQRLGRINSIVDVKQFREL